MKQTTSRILALITILLPIVSWATPPFLVPAWQTEALFEQPESVVYHADSNQLLVANINGNPTQADGNGYISLLSLDGKVINQHWLSGLNAPKGMAIVGNKLYAADINELIVIDIVTNKTNNIVGTISERHLAPNAKFLNDVAADKAGNIYVSGFLTNSIYRLSKGKFELWLQSAQLEVPNGLLVENEQLIVASWGEMTDGFATAIAGHIKTVSLANKKIQSLGDKTPAGNLDGLESDGNGNYLVTDWMAGKLLHISPTGTSTTLLDLEQGSADHTIVHSQGLVIIPMMNSGYITAYKIKENP